MCFAQTFISNSFEGNDSQKTNIITTMRDAHGCMDLIQNSITDINSKTALKVVIQSSVRGHVYNTYYFDQGHVIIPLTARDT